MTKEQPEFLSTKQHRSETLKLMRSITNIPVSSLGASEITRYQQENADSGGTIPKQPFAWWLIGGTDIFLASEFTPDSEHQSDWAPLYRQ